MRGPDNRSREIIEIISDVVAKTSEGCVITITDDEGTHHAIECPEIHYVFGNGKYVKDNLDELSRIDGGDELKFPLIALFCPFIERRDSPDWYTRAKVRLLIACPSSADWSNEMRLETSFQNILRPIYNSLLIALKVDGRFDFGYNGHVDHEYSENYSYGRYGAVAENGEKVSEFIDAINITNLELKVKLQKCR